MLDVALLGTGGMMPMPGRFLSSMLLRVNGRLLLVDCGEGTQVSLKNLGWGFKVIDAILFTHYHADHISGLPGMLLAIANAGRTEPLALFGPKGLTFVVEGLRRIAQELPFMVEYYELNRGGEELYQAAGLEISYLPVDHSVPCLAYRFRLRRQGRFDAHKAEKLGLPRVYWSKLQKGEEVVFHGRKFLKEMVLGEERPGLTLTYCTDSRPTAQLPGFAKNSDLLVLEGMYGEDEKKPKAIQNKHMLFSEAARVAKEAGAKRLWLTHYSPALKEPAPFLPVAQAIFPETELGFDGKMETLSFPEAR
ncbi:MAG TPA: ribonuclease Z [Firmicutes bacterium]|mgnify:CR=1 FL=1|nr:ribonuclease Z [Bacillota bacterium]